MDFFSMVPDFDLNLMRPSQDLKEFKDICFKKVNAIVEEVHPDVVIVQGDTTTALVGAMAGREQQVPVAHVEAGLRSFDDRSPFPEELNRKKISKIADFHFTPTKNASANLKVEGIDQGIYEVGNTVIDAMLSGIKKIKNDYSLHSGLLKSVNFSKKTVLITCHRRESFGGPFRSVCEAIKTLAQKHSDLEFIFPVHLNPKIKENASVFLNNIKNVKLLSPLSYPDLLYLLTQCHLILTDSGGLQEEAPSLGIPVLVLRDVTERTEGIEVGNAILVGTEKDTIVNQVDLLLRNNSLYQTMAKVKNPYGDGLSSNRILSVLETVV